MQPRGRFGLALYESDDAFNVSNIFVASAFFRLTGMLLSGNTLG